MHHLVADRVVRQQMFEVDVETHVFLEQVIHDHGLELAQQALHLGHLAGETGGTDILKGFEQLLVVVLERSDQLGVVVDVRAGCIGGLFLRHRWGNMHDDRLAGRGRGSFLVAEQQVE